MPASCSSLYFEKAYCLYRLNQNTEALEVISQAPEQTLQLKELRAQLFYKLDRYVAEKRSLCHG